MYKLLTLLFLTTALLNGNCQNQKQKKSEKKGKVKTELPQNTDFKSISPRDYQSFLGKGMDVDWVKTGKGTHYYNKQIVKDFKHIGLSHVRIRIKDEATEQLLKHLDKVVLDCLNENLIPIIAYQGADFKGKPTDENLNKTVLWWTKVAEFSKKYPAQVSFDLIIEVTEALNKEPEMLNRLYEKTVAEIRKTNPKRIVFISPIVRSAPEYLKDLKIPSQHNNFLMAEWHFYASGPDKTNENKKWTTGTEEEKNLIRAKIKAAKEWSDKTRILTWVGAWMPGNYNKGDEYTVSEQVAFANFVTCELTRNKIPFAFNSDVKFYDRENNKWITEMKPILEEIIKTDCK